MNAQNEKDEIEQFREMILGGDRGKIDRLDHQMNDLDCRLEMLSHDLPEAFRLQEVGTDEFDELVNALRVSVEATIKASVDHESSSMASTLAPVMGPAIQRYVSSAITNLTRSINQTIEDATSFQRWKWKIQARLSGCSFEEFMVMKAASYEVDEVFLIDRQSLDLVCYASADSDIHQMDFDLDSVPEVYSRIVDRLKEGQPDGAVMFVEELLDFSDCDVVCKESGNVVVAAVVHGSIDPHYGRDLQEVTEDLDKRYGDMLTQRRENPISHEALKKEPLSLLSNCIRSKKKEVLESPNVMVTRMIYATVAIAVAGFLALWLWNQHRWNHVEDAFVSEPGYAEIVFENHWGKRVLSGLRDPAGKSPEAVLERFDLPEDSVAFDFRLFQSLDTPSFRERVWEEKVSEREKTAEMVELQETVSKLESALEESRRMSDERASEQQRMDEAREMQTLELLRQRLGLSKEDLGLTIRDHVLVVQGEAPAPVLEELKLASLHHELIDGVDLAGAQASGLSRQEKILSDLQRLRMRYVDGTDKLTEEGAENEMLMINLISELNGLLEGEAAMSIHIHSYPITGKNTEVNEMTRRARANRIVDKLVSRGIVPKTMIAPVYHDALPANKRESGIQLEVTMN